MPATGLVRAGAHVGHGARDGAGGRDAAEERHDEVGDALRHQLLVGVVAGASIRLSATRAHSSDSIAPSSAIVSVGISSCLARCPAERAAARSVGRRLRDAAEAGADGLDRQLQQHGRPAWPAHQRDDRCPARARRCAACGLRAAPVGSSEHGEQAWARATTHRPGRPAPSASAYGLKRVEVARQHVRSGRRSRPAACRSCRPEQVLHLRQRDQHRDAVGEADDDGHRDVAHQRAQLEAAPSANSSTPASAVAISRLVRP